MVIRVIKFKEEYTNGKAVEMVLVAPTGEAHQKTQTWHRVDRLRPPEVMDDKMRNADTFVAMQARWSVIGPAYDAWKAGTDIPETGLPLAAWSGVTADQAGFLKNMGIRTVEDVRDMSESAFNKLPFPNARQLPKLAASFLAGEDATAKDKRIADMEEKMAAMTEMLEKSMAAEPKASKKDKAAA